MALVQVSDNLILSNKGIKSIRYVDVMGDGKNFQIEVRYLNNHTETIDPKVVSMEELLVKLGRSPRQQGAADSP